jgi:hypothetical protein
MRDASYILAGYAITGAALALYRFELARRTRRAHRVVTALTGRSPQRGRPRR